MIGLGLFTPTGKGVSNAGLKRIHMFFTTAGNQKCLLDIIMVGQTRPLKLIMPKQPSRMSSFIAKCRPDFMFWPDVLTDRCKDDRQMWVIHLIFSKKKISQLETFKRQGT